MTFFAEAAATFSPLFVWASSYVKLFQPYFMCGQVIHTQASRTYDKRTYKNSREGKNLSRNNLIQKVVQTLVSDLFANMHYI